MLRRRGSSVIAFLCFSTKEPFCPWPGPFQASEQPVPPGPIAQAKQGSAGSVTLAARVQPQAWPASGGSPLSWPSSWGLRQWSWFSHQGGSLSYSEAYLASCSNPRTWGSGGSLPARLMSWPPRGPGGTLCLGFCPLQRKTPSQPPPQQSQLGHTQPHCSQAAPHRAGTEDDIQVVAVQVCVEERTPCYCISGGVPGFQMTVL